MPPPVHTLSPVTPTQHKQQTQQTQQHFSAFLCLTPPQSELTAKIPSNCLTLTTAHNACLDIFLKFSHLPIKTLHLPKASEEANVVDIRLLPRTLGTGKAL